MIFNKEFANCIFRLKSINIFSITVPNRPLLIHKINQISQFLFFCFLVFYLPSINISIINFDKI